MIYVICDWQLVCKFEMVKWICGDYIRLDI